MNARQRRTARRADQRHARALVAAFRGVFPGLRLSYERTVTGRQVEPHRPPFHNFPGLFRVNAGGGRPGPDIVLPDGTGFDR